ncbi:hypothetical protein BDA96_02G364500 [Sorghum bicolor]|uniref:Uncharacterized protein n=1 Tax=Sorghum bicolor TaxID=4558 RepID=A0A921RRU4_SORBI|nr:hypothetical protein BDA96_02G364500 [Sorghum bicolor]
MAIMSTQRHYVSFYLLLFQRLYLMIYLLLQIVYFSFQYISYTALYCTKNIDWMASGLRTGG